MKKTWNFLLYILCGYLLIRLSASILIPVGLPFLIGWSLAQLARPLRPKRWKPGIAAIFSVSIIFSILCLLLYFLGKTLLSEAESLAHRLPGLLERLSDPLENLYAGLLRLAAKLPDSIAPAAVQWVEKLFAGSSIVVSSLSEWVLGWAAQLLSCVPNLVLFILTALLSAYFFAADQEKIAGLFRKHLPEQWLLRSKTLWKRLKKALGGYFKAQLYLAGISLLLCALGLLILRQKNVLLFSVIIALVDALPVFGAGTVLIPWGLICFVQGNSFLGAGLLLLYAVVAISRTVLEPRFLGKQIGLHPLVTLIALYGGFKLFGILGMILLPIAFLLGKQLYDLSQDF